MTLVRRVWHGKKAKALEHDAVVRALHSVVEHVAEESARLVPIDKKTLLDSRNAEVDEQELKGLVSYSTPYAVRQHEELTWQHDAGKQAKYLEVPLNAAKSSKLLERRIEEEMEKKL